MGIFFAIYYAVMALAPPVMGALLDLTGSVAAACSGEALTIAHLPVRHRQHENPQ